MRINGLKTDSLTDGEGMRFVIFMQGCHHRCEGCHNPNTWNYLSGKDVTDEYLISLIKTNRKWIKGITLSGGDPLYQLDATKIFLKKFRDIFSQTLDVWLYTGYKFEQIPKGITQFCDIIVDGKYDKNIPPKKYRGSGNQRIMSRYESTNKFIERIYANVT